VVEVSLASFGLAVEGRVYTWLRVLADRRSTLPPHLITGQRGEDVAFFYLRGLGYTVVARRWRAARMRGDLDLVAWDGETLVIVEVKTRTAHDMAAAEVEVDEHKRRQLRKMAAVYKSRLPEAHRAAVRVRFDVVAVYLLGSGTEVEVIRDAFPLVAARPKRGWGWR